MRHKHLIAVFALLVFTFPASFAHAAGTVSNCDETSLLAALAGGGSVTFACDGTITLTNPLVLTFNTTIDGSGQAVTISGNNLVPVFIVPQTDSTFNLNGLTIANGRSAFGGAIAVYGPNTTLTITNSTFIGNSATSTGGAIAVYGPNTTLTITNSTFTGNSATSAGGAIWFATTRSATLHFNRFVGNTAPAGSAIWGVSLADATNNWWGSNANPSGMVFDSVTVNPWLMLNVSASPDQINPSGTSAVTADLTHNSIGQDTSGSGHVPDGIPVSFTTTFGTIPSPVNTLNGKAVATFTAGATPGLADVQATVDSSTVPTTIRINASPSVPAFSPWGVMVFAILLAASAFLVSRRRKRIS